ncbi:hypothetical protein Patl1_24691 [Pistacia atlantica]|uniref:Uncharacterized protein n=1 Tax=Pistacia atlantica TaxID=434234 RepID=A0ACC1AYQ8_9ROSI|nr:hypothetical protein Patl1_24691 [Pistacia atlantica]
MTGIHLVFSLNLNPLLSPANPPPIPTSAASFSPSNPYNNGKFSIEQSFKETQKLPKTSKHTLTRQKQCSKLTKTNTCFDVPAESRSGIASALYERLSNVAGEADRSDRMLLTADGVTRQIDIQFGSKTRHFKWEVEYMFRTPARMEHGLMGINGQFPGPTIRAKAGDTISVEVTNKLHT